MTVGKRIGWTGLSILALVAAFGVQIVASMIIILPYALVEGIRQGMQAANGQDPGRMAEEFMANMGGIMGIVLVAAGVLLLMVFLPWYYFGCGRKKFTRESVSRVFSPRALLVVFLIAIALNYGINCLLQLVYVLAPQALGYYQQLMENAGIGSDLWANLAAVILAPLGEELVFRGVAFHYARKAVEGMRRPGTAFWIANCIQALLFGIYHMNLIQGIYAFVIGLVLGYLFQRYGSLIPGVLAHLVFNGMSALLGDTAYAWIPESVIWYAVIGVAGIGLVLIIMIKNGFASVDNEQNVA